MRTLVTGVPGWLGSRLLEVLVNKPEELSQYDSIKDRKIRCLVLPGSHISDLKKFDIEICKGDVRDKESLALAVKEVDAIIHCAGVIHPKRVRDYYEINTWGTENLISTAVDAGVKKFIYISSNSVGGTNRDKNILMREQNPPRPYKHYGLSKYMAEEIVRQYFKEKKIDTVILRPCWFYGPGQPTRQTRFFRMIKKGNPIIFGDGKNLRSLSYIDNLIQGILLVENNDKANGQTYWIADEKPYEAIEIYQTIAELLGIELRPRFLPNFVSWGCKLIDDVLQGIGLYITEFHVAGKVNKNIACSIEKAKDELGYNPKINLREGMRRSIEWCRENRINI